jgi:hypothetical protein
MKFSFKLDPKTGLHISAQLCPAILRVLLTAIAGLASLPWLTQLIQVMGWM